MDLSESEGYAFGHRDAVNSLSLLCIGPIPLPDQINAFVPSSNHHPCYAGDLIFNLPLIPSLPNLLSQLLVNQQGFDVEFGEMSGVAVTSPET